MTIVVYIGIAQAIFLSGLLLTKNKKLTFDYILLSWLVLNAVQLFYFNISFTRTTEQYNTPILIIGGLLQLLVAPLLYFYVRALVIPKPFLLRHHTHHFIPFVIQVSTFLYFYFFKSNEMSIWVSEGFIKMNGPRPINLGYYGLVLAFFSFLYPCLCLYLLFKHKTRIDQEFSYHDKVRMDWLRHWILLELAGFIISFTVIWAGEFRWVELMTSFQVVAGLIILNIMVIGFYGIRQQAIFTSINTVPNTSNQTPEPKYKKSSLSKGEQQRLKDRLEQVMTNEKPFLQSKLDIDQLAETVGTSKHNLSQTLNDAMDLNFYDFVNRYRVEEFKKRCTAPENDHLSLLGVALDCGFNSKSSFNYIFKKSEGITPSQFKLKKVAN